MKLSIIIPVCEEAEINEFLGELMKIGRINEAEIIVVDCSKKRETVEKITDTSVKKIISKKGRALQQNAGARVAKGDVLLFLHADTRLPKNAISAIEKALEDERVHGGAFKLGYGTRNILLGIIGFFENIRVIVSRIPYGDHALFIRKKTFEKLGGFKKIPFLEEVYLAEKLKRKKLKIQIVREKVVTSPRRWRKNGIIRQTFTNRKIMGGHRRGKTPEELLKLYR